ncbi:hypothetical protein DRQ17_00580 [bacterium]|nr:MAG: hypothetical protein DRQ17_00580 [bacterium]
MKRAVFSLLLVGVMVLYGTVTTSRMNRLEKGARFEVWGIDSLVSSPELSDTLIFSNIFKVGDFEGVVVQYRGNGEATAGAWLIQYQRLQTKRDTSWGKWIDVGNIEVKADTQFNLSGIPFQSYIRFRLVCSTASDDTIFLWMRISKWGR